MDKIDNNVVKTHHMIVKNRESLEITGLIKIDTVTTSSFVISTVAGLLTIQGTNLEIVNLDVTTGQLTISGNVNNVIYDDTKDNETKKNNFIKKFFK